MRLVFMGTPEFSVPSLDAVCEIAEVVGVITQPDRPAGRGHRYKSPPVKIKAAKRGLLTFQPEKVNDPEFIDMVGRISPDAIAVVAFGQKIPRELLELPKYGCINVHASLLPKHRGAAPINWSIINGDTVSGVTTMLMDEGWDTGGILLQSEVRIEDNWDAGDLHDVLSAKGADLLAQTLVLLEKDRISPIEQDERYATNAPRITKEICRIDWNQSSGSIRNLVRGLSPYPGAFTHRALTGEAIKVFGAVVKDAEGKGSDPGSGGASNAKPGSVVCASSSGGLCVRTGDGVLELVEVQPENGKRMSGVDYINGHNVGISEMLG